ncbi:hypothetical protein ACFSHR_04075 [Azotobacter chroococcum]
MQVAAVGFLSVLEQGACPGDLRVGDFVFPAFGRADGIEVLPGSLWETQGDSLFGQCSRQYIEHSGVRGLRGIEAQEVACAQ